MTNDCFILLRWINADEAPTPPAILELDDRGDDSEERVILAASHIMPGLELRPALPHEDRTASDELATEAFDAEPLRIRVAPVARTAYAFLVCHCENSLRGIRQTEVYLTSPLSILSNRVNLNRSEILAMTVLTLELFAALEFEDDDLRPATVFDDCAGDARAFD